MQVQITENENKSDHTNNTVRKTQNSSYLNSLNNSPNKSNHSIGDKNVAIRKGF